MGLDKNNIPDEYLCEVCKPRPVDRKKARAMQAKRRSELFNSSNDDSPRHGKKANARSAANKKMLERIILLYMAGQEKREETRLNILTLFQSAPL